MITSVSNSFPSVPEPPNLDKLGVFCSRKPRDVSCSMLGATASSVTASYCQAVFNGGSIANYFLTPFTCYMGVFGLASSYLLTNQVLAQRDIRHAIGDYHQSLFGYMKEMHDMTAQKLLAKPGQDSGQCAVTSIDQPAGTEQSTSHDVVVKQPQPDGFATSQQSTTQDVVMIQPEKGSFTPD